MALLRILLSRFFRAAGLRARRGSAAAGDDPGHLRFNPKKCEFEDILHYRIRNTDLFVHALMHRSSLQQHHPTAASNERLEYLGDSILNLIVGEYLYHHFPDAEEGELTKMRSRLVNRKALAAYATSIRLGEFVQTSPSASGTLGKGRETITSDCLEAVVAALYLDGGFAAARKFLERLIFEAIDLGDVATADDNYKSRLLEYSQGRGFGVPRYAIIREEGPDHDRTFTVNVMLAGIRKGTGKGKNKKEAEQAAAEQALEHLS
jgi:ribonuclease-3